jgi:D-beta-D-heptose 7-phosphate kinase/D-beta-D-heptose 1-phosphate adenosyltransferase
MKKRSPPGKKKQALHRRGSRRKHVVVAVSGGFDPIHIGHVRMFERAKALGDELVVILNNDNWLTKKKGYVFMPEEERKEVIEALWAVDRVMLTGHKPNPDDMGVSAEIKKLRPHIFGKGGDRSPSDTPIPGSEVETCGAINCKIVYNLGRGGKVQSSSWLVDKLRKQKNRLS